jgi:endogenous inhibitor of DNA gyrase (YacG/DUF329 family)
MIDLGRWLGEDYRFAPEPSEESAEPDIEQETP